MYFENATQVDTVDIFGEMLLSKKEPFALIIRDVTNNGGYHMKLFNDEKEYIKHFNYHLNENLRHFCFTIIRKENGKFFQGWDKTLKGM